MKLKKKEFRCGYQKTEFYAIMGQFFAERQYRREMPYLVNTDEKSWVLFYESENLVAFYAYEEKKDVTDVSGIYVLPAYRKNRAGHEMVKDIMKRFQVVHIITNTDEMLSLLKKNHFEEVTARGSYKTMEWRKQDGT